MQLQVLKKRLESFYDFYIDTNMSKYICALISMQNEIDYWNNRACKFIGIKAVNLTGFGKTRHLCTKINI